MLVAAGTRSGVVALCTRVGGQSLAFPADGVTRPGRAVAALLAPMAPMALPQPANKPVSRDSAT
jgi:hypothetical protein